MPIGEIELQHLRFGEIPAAPQLRLQSKYRGLFTQVSRAAEKFSPRADGHGILLNARRSTRPGAKNKNGARIRSRKVDSEKSQPIAMLIAALSLGVSVDAVLRYRQG